MNLLIIGTILEVVGGFLGAMKFIEIQNTWYVTQSQYTTLILYILMVIVGMILDFFGKAQAKNKKLMDNVVAQDVNVNQEIICPNCGLSIKKGETRCPKCGLELQDNE